MRIPTKDSAQGLIDEINSKDYIENPDERIKTKVEYPEQQPSGVSRDQVVRILKKNYVEPSKHVQQIYENQFRSFSRSNHKDDSFDAIL